MIEKKDKSKRLMEELNTVNEKYMHLISPSLYKE